jgi:DNA mismatch repair protein MutS
VIAAAKRKLAQLEVSQVAQHTPSMPQTDMFMVSDQEVEPAQHPVIAELESMQADDLTPKQALDFLYKLKDLLSNS